MTATPLEWLLAEELPTGTFGGPRSATPDPAANRAILAQALKTPSRTRVDTSTRQPNPPTRPATPPRTPPEAA